VPWTEDWFKDLVNFRKKEFWDCHAETSKIWKVLGPHSCYSLNKNPRFLQNFRPVNNTLKGYFWPILFNNLPL
jgi:hypothetical protein